MNANTKRGQVRRSLSTDPCQITTFNRKNKMKYWQAWMACGLVMSLPAAAQADIFRWDNGELIPGTEDIRPGPGVDLSSPMGEWNSPQRNLRFADFWGGGPGLDLTEANFSG